MVDNVLGILATVRQHLAGLVDEPERGVDGEDLGAGAQRGVDPQVELQLAAGGVGGREPPETQLLKVFVNDLQKR